MHDETFFVKRNQSRRFTRATRTTALVISEPAVVNVTALEVVEVVDVEVEKVAEKVDGGDVIVEIQSKYDLTRVKPLG